MTAKGATRFLCPLDIVRKADEESSAQQFKKMSAIQLETGDRGILVCSIVTAPKQIPFTSIGKVHRLPPCDG